MTTEEYRKQTFLSTLLRGTLVFLFGLVLTLWPALSASLFYLIIGVALLVLGAGCIILYFTKPKPAGLVDNRMTRGLLFLLLGLVLLLMSDSFVALLPIVLSIALIFCGLERMQLGIYLSGIRYPRWGLIVISSAVVVLLGVMMLINPFGAGVTFTILYGIFAMLEGVLGVVSAFLFHNAIKQDGGAAHEAPKAVVEAVVQTAEPVIDEAVDAQQQDTTENTVE